MDAISYSYADKQAKRIKKFIENPDSASGVLTVPKVIAAGETITIPEGRVAILPDVQVDGTLNVEGDVFIPTGASISTMVSKTTMTDNSIVRANGNDGEIQGSSVTIDDDGNITLGTTGLNPTIRIATEGTTTQNTISTLDLTARGSNGIYNNTDIQSLGSSTAGGTLLFRTDDSNGVIAERMRIDPNGNVGIGVTPSAWSVYKAIDLSTTASISQGYGNTAISSNCYGTTGGIFKYKANGPTTRFNQVSGKFEWFTAPSGTADNAITWTNAMTLTQSGRLLLGTSTDNGVDKLQVNGSITSRSSFEKYNNLNDAKTIDENTIVANTCLNIPINDYGYVTIQVSTPYTYCVQTFIGLNSPARIFIRVLAGGIWSAWVEK